MRPVYSAGVHRLLTHARQAAGQYRHRFIHTEYLLLGLLKERNTATRVLKSLGFERERLRRTCERRCRRGQHEMEGEIKLTPRVQHIMALAAEQMQAMGDRELSTVHVLLGMLLEEEGIAGQVLRQSGVTVEAVRATALQMASGAENASLETGDPQDRRKPFWKRLLGM
ncbi:MAG: Clp protease N-terminal domain-containing protein [Chloroherpetonaceae bacterium]|nr:hypothetical protein [Chthonomonadaceae bacterium]MDW8208959.1 Clp protease N-terminal domain-containing protein [Chloroherpetonaceae bacterium]